MLSKQNSGCYSQGCHHEIEADDEAGHEIIIQHSHSGPSLNVEAFQHDDFGESVGHVQAMNGDS